MIHQNNIRIVQREVHRISNRSDNHINPNNQLSNPSSQFSNPSSQLSSLKIYHSQQLKDKV